MLKFLRRIFSKRPRVLHVYVLASGPRGGGTIFSFPVEALRAVAESDGHGRIYRAQIACGASYVDVTGRRLERQNLDIVVEFDR